MHTQTITVQDSTDPVIDTMPSNLTVECDGNGNTTELNNWLANNAGAMASDNCGNVTITNNLVNTNDGCGQTTTYTYNFIATDTCGNSTIEQAMFIIVDTTAPIITLEATDLTVECDGSGNANDLNAWLNNNAGAVASDNCGNIIWSNDFSGLNDECGTTGTATVTFTATDGCGLTATTTAIFTIQDTTNPIIVEQASNLSVECDGLGNTEALQQWLNENGGASASDSCSSIVSWSNNFNSFDFDCGATGSVTVDFMATDDCGNETMTSATFTIEDTTAPNFVETLPQDRVLNCEDTIPTVINLTATDSCGTATVSFNETIEDQSCDNSYVIVRTWTATDACGNENSHMQRLFIEDTTPPQFVTNLPEDLFINLEGCDIDNLPEPSIVEAIDNCGSVDITYSQTETPGDCEGKFTVTREWIATDSCGNTNAHTQTINVSCEVIIYNAVSTFNDGNDNFFKIEGINCYPNNHVKIFNRWGVIVYETRGYDNITNVFKGFSDGRATFNKNEELPTGNYFYIIEYEFSVDGVNSEILNESGYLYLNSNN